MAGDGALPSTEQRAQAASLGRFPIAAGCLAEGWKPPPDPAPTAPPSALLELSAKSASNSGAERVGRLARRGRERGSSGAEGRARSLPGCPWRRPLHPCRRHRWERAALERNSASWKGYEAQLMAHNVHSCDRSSRSDRNEWNETDHTFSWWIMRRIQTGEKRTGNKPGLDSEMSRKTASASFFLSEEFAKNAPVARFPSALSFLLSRVLRYAEISPYIKMRSQAG